MTSRRGLYPALFDAFLEIPDDDDSEPPPPSSQNILGSESDFEPIPAIVS
jgi:hypothetical protein